MASASPESKAKLPTNYRWTVVTLTFIITIINYLDRSAISYAINPLKKEFNLTDTSFGFIASAFSIGYMVMTVGGGILVDRYGARLVWSLSAFAWSACTAALGICNGFWTLFFTRTMLGIAEGPNFPALTRAVTDWLPTEERARATAWGLAAVPFANVIGAPLISHLIVHLSWQMMFFILGSLGIFWAILWHWLFTDRPEDSPHCSKEEVAYIRQGQTQQAPSLAHEAPNKTTWKFMLLNPALLSNNISFFAFGYLLFFALTWLPAYLEETYHVHLKDAGTFLIAPWLTSAILLTVAGYVSDYLWKKTGSIRVARSHMIWICQLLSCLCFIPLLYVHDLNFSILMISLGVGLGLMPNAAFYALNADLAHDRAATSLGVMDCFFALAGILAPAVTGILTDATGNFNAAFILLMVLNIIGVISVLVFQHPDKHLKTTTSG